MIRIINWYSRFVKGQIHDLPRGDTSRGWTILGLWVLLLVPLAAAIAALYIFFSWTGVLTAIVILLCIDIIFRLVDHLSK